MKQILLRKIEELGQLIKFVEKSGGKFWFSSEALIRMNYSFFNKYFSFTAVIGKSYPDFLASLID